MKNLEKNSDDFADYENRFIDKLVSGMPWFLLGFLTAILLVILLFNEKPI